MRTVHILVSGRVQGVFYRKSMHSVAKELGISGYAKNLPTGKVEMVAQGGRIEEFLRLVHRGPPSAKVDEVKIQDIDEPEEFDDFIIM
jgi:acylphosphatase